MNMDLFWLHKSFYGPGEADVGFSVFSAPHLIWLTLMAAFIAVFSFYYHRGNEDRRGNMRKSLALFLILFELFKLCLMALTGAPVREHLPLEVCSLAEYAMLADAFWPGNRFLGQLMAYIFLPAAIMALVFPTVTAYPPVSFYSIHQFVFHACIVAYIIARYAAGEIRPRYAGLWASALVIAVLTVPIYLLNAKFGTNFFFLMAHRDNAVLKPLWNLSGGTGGVKYVIALIAFIAVVLHVVAGLYVLIGWAMRKAEKKECAG